MHLKKIRIFLISACILLYGDFGNTAPELNRLFVDAARKGKPSVVNIIIYQTTLKDGVKVYSKSAYGSGTIITGDGYIATNYHVVKKGNYYQVFLYDNTECELESFAGGKYYIADPKSDIALLKINSGKNINLIPVTIANSNYLEEGEWVIAIGNPYGLKQSITSGIVSSKGRNDVGFADIEDFIQTDVPINPGNSGGPLLNLNGELVGINTAIRTISGGFQGISFAIPSNIVKQVSLELRRFGRIRRGWLGFLARENRIFRNGEKTMVEVISVIKDSPAQVSGITKGDIIKEIDGKEISTLGELISSIGNKPIGSKILIKISRDGRIMQHALALIEKEDFQASISENKSLAFLYGIELNENSETGDVVISYLSPMGIGYQYGLKKGDIIQSINGEDVSNLKELTKVFYRHKSKIFRIVINRDSKLFTINFSGEQE